MALQYTVRFYGQEMLVTRQFSSGCELKRGDARAAGYARVLQTSSVESQQSSPGYLPYAVSKWALMAMQEQWYSTHAAENVRPAPRPQCHVHTQASSHRAKASRRSR